MRAVFAVLVLAMLGACKGTAPDVVMATRATYDAIAPEYSAYVEADTTLTAEQLNRRRRSLTTWEAFVIALEENQ